MAANVIVMLSHLVKFQDVRSIPAHISINLYIFLLRGRKRELTIWPDVLLLS